jgi:hypothetical protein
MVVDLLEQLDNADEHDIDLLVDLLGLGGGLRSLRRRA